MGLTDPHDDRVFTSFVKLHPDGSVAAIVEVADTSLPHRDPGDDGCCYVDVTEFRKAKTVVDLYALTLDGTAVQAAMLLPVNERPSLLTELNAALVAAVPAALAAAVFGPPDG